jgi:glycosyltransferase involved in cell wall biosynthesis
MKKEILIIMPVYNEEDMIETVIDDWLKLEVEIPIKILLINDGSQDKSKDIIKKKITLNEKNLLLIDQVNAGHGSAILTGYRYAIQNGYEYIFQTDSDYQFRSKDFNKLWEKKDSEYDMLLGVRKSRNDSLLRVFLSKFILRFVLMPLSGKFLIDANVPFRLINNNFLKNFLSILENKSFLAPNILMSIYAKKIIHINVSHYKRSAGELNWSIKKLFNFGLKLIIEILQFVFRK